MRPRSCALLLSSVVLCWSVSSDVASVSEPDACTTTRGWLVFLFSKENNNTRKDSKLHDPKIYVRPDLIVREFPLRLCTVTTITQPKPNQTQPNPTKPNPTKPKHTSITQPQPTCQRYKSQPINTEIDILPPCAYRTDYIINNPQ